MWKKKSHYQLPRKMSSKTNDTDNLTIGTVVRCEQPNGTMRTATVAYINKNSTVDLIYSSSAVADGLSNSTTKCKHKLKDNHTKINTKLKTSKITWKP